MPVAMSPSNDRQIVRTFQLGAPVMNNEIIEIEERLEPNGDIFFDIYVGKKPNINRQLWKSYTPRTSDIEREYEL